MNLLVYLADVDAFVKQAEAAGAAAGRSVYEDRMATLTDPYRHGWSIATHVVDVSAEEMERRMQQEWPAPLSAAAPPSAS